MLKIKFSNGFYRLIKENMKKLITKKTHLVFSIFVLVLSAISLQAQNKKQITLDDIYAKGTFQMAGVSGFTSLNDSRYYCNMDNDANVTTAIEVTAKYPKKELVQPTKGDKMNRAQFQEAMKKIMDDMQKGGGMRIRINQ